MLFSRCRSSVALICVLAAASITSAQTPGPTSGEITVQLTAGLDSATNPKAMSQGVVTKSSNPAIPVRTAVVAGLGSDPVNGGYTAKLVALMLNGRAVPAASSAAALAPDVMSKVPGFLRPQPQTKSSVSGTRVFLPAQTFIKFTLTEPPAQTVKPPLDQRAAGQNAQSSSALLPSTWRFSAIENGGHEAAIQGFAESAGNRSRVVLALQCTIFHPTDQPAPNASANAELRLARGLISFPEETTDCAFDGGGNDYGRFQIGTLPETKGDFCSSGDFPTSPSETVKISLSLPQRELIKAAGSSLHVGVQLPDGQGSPLNIRFQLPQDAGALDAMMDPCLQILEEQERQRKAAIVVSCPTLPGQGLRRVDVLMTSTMKPLPPDPDNDIGVVWNLPKKTKVRPVPPKTTLACYYGAGSRPVEHEVLQKKLLPIPPTAVTCEYRGDGHCSK